MKFETYVNIAKVKNKINSTNKLAKIIGVSAPSLHLFIKEKSTPSPDTVLKIAELAGYDSKEVILDVLIERYKNTRTESVLKDIKNLTIKS